MKDLFRTILTNHGNKAFIDLKSIPSSIYKSSSYLSIFMLVIQVYVI